MKIGENKFVSLSYTLKVDDLVVEDVKADKPLSFVFGTGGLLPKFEENIEGKSVGDKFAFTLTSDEAYGDKHPEAVVDLPINIFMVDGKLNEEMVQMGNMLPMMDNEGNRLLGIVKSVNEDTVTMDFNHPMAGQTLNFEGEIVGIREATEADIIAGMAAGGGCGCECGDCDSDCGCEEDKSSCGCGCN